MTFQSRSQAGQDRFVRALLGEGPGTFLEIGSNHPIEINNTYALEQLGWRGVLVDNDDVCAKLCGEMRVSPMLKADATKVDWRKLFVDSRWCTNDPTKRIVPFEYGGEFPDGLTVGIDYLSLDVDNATLATLQGMPLDLLRFKVITIEHDAYRFGAGPREAMRRILMEQGYQLVAGNVKDQGMSFEDWWCDRGAVEMAKWAPFHSDNKEWQEVLTSIL